MLEPKSQLSPSLAVHPEPQDNSTHPDGEFSVRDSGDESQGVGLLAETH
jgi:hypothetical protein